VLPVKFGAATLVKALAAPLFVLACGDATGPGRTTLNPPIVSDVWIRNPIRAGGILHIVAQPVDASYRLPPGEHALLVATSSAGEFELIKLRPFVCDLAYVCNQFTIYMREGREVSSTEPGVRSLNARIVAMLGRVGGGHAFGNLTFTMDSVRRLSGVQSVERSVVLFGGDGESFYARIAGAVPFERGAPRARDGVFSAVPGDTVRLTYLQPGGGVITAERILHPADD
jgi:hypothetical protein